jgi:hypothetical protein
MSPIFEYVCPLGHVSEVIDVSSKSRLPSLACPACGAKADKVVSVTHWQRGDPAKPSLVSQAIDRVRTAARVGKLG